VIGLGFQGHAPEYHAGIVTQHLVVIARDVNDTRPLACLAQQLLNNVIVGLRAVPGFSQAPAIDNVTDQVKTVGFGVPEKVQEVLGFAPACAQMDVGNPDCTIMVSQGFAAHDRPEC